jgi:hypothetical protein
MLTGGTMWRGRWPANSTPRLFGIIAMYSSVIAAVSRTHHSVLQPFALVNELHGVVLFCNPLRWVQLQLQCKCS